MDCPICKETMNTLEYADECPLDPSDIVRLCCHHAFHGRCIVQALRTNSGCPVCRDGAPVAIVSDFIQFLQINDNIEEPSEESSVEEDLIMQSILTRHIPIKRMQRRVNLARKQYNITRDKLRHRRRVVLQAALNKLRDEEYMRLQSDANLYINELNTLREMHLQEYSRRTSEELMIQEYNLYRTENMRDRLIVEIDRKQEPLLNGFWKP